LGGSGGAGGGPGYEERREKVRFDAFCSIRETAVYRTHFRGPTHVVLQMLQAAEEREKDNMMKGLKTQKAANKLRTYATDTSRPEAPTRRDDVARDWHS